MNTLKELQQILKNEKEFLFFDSWKNEIVTIKEKVINIRIK